MLIVRSDNLKGILLMVLAMALFAIEDAFIKSTASALPVWEILVFMGLGGIVVFSALLVIRQEKFLPPDILSKAIAYRLFGEIVGRVSYSLAIALGSLAVVSAVLQATPLSVTVGAVLFFGEHVGPRRWAAIGVGFIGVLLIIKPGMDGFQAASLLAVIGLVGLSIRDLATRVAPSTLSNYQLGLYGFLALIPSALMMMPFSDPWVSPLQVWPSLVGLTAVGSAAYFFVTAAMRIGEVSMVTPFRYTRILFAVFVSIVFFSEEIDSLTVVGILIVIASGLYLLWRERIRLR